MRARTAVCVAGGNACARQSPAPATSLHPLKAAPLQMQVRHRQCVAGWGRHGAMWKYSVCVHTCSGAARRGRDPCKRPQAAHALAHATHAQEASSKHAGAAGRAAGTTPANAWQSWRGRARPGLAPCPTAMLTPARRAPPATRCGLRISARWLVRLVWFVIDWRAAMTRRHMHYVSPPFEMCCGRAQGTRDDAQLSFHEMRDARRPTRRWRHAGLTGP